MRRQVLVLLLLAMSMSRCTPQRALEEALLIDDIVRDAAVRSYQGRHRRTGAMYRLPLPGRLSEAEAAVSRFRAGSLRRYGAYRFGEFSVPPGLVVHRRVRHLLAVRINLGNLSTVYAAAGGRLRLASPVLGLLFYTVAQRRNGTANLEILVTRAPIRVNFSGLVDALEPGLAPLCMAVDVHGNVSVAKQTGSSICYVWNQGHFGLVVGGEEVAGDGGSRWKLALFGAALGAGATVLLGLVVVAVASVRRRKSRMAEMERRAYAEEALRLSMVGHVRAPSAAGVRTTPTLEDEYCATL